jgi:electron transfer flavoprotein alpha subunit
MEKHIIIAEHNNESISNTTLSAICASNKIEGKKTILILCSDKKVGLNLGSSVKHLVHDVIYVCNKAFDNALSQPYAECISNVIQDLNINYIWGGSSSFIKETFPRLCARIPNSCMASDVQRIVKDNVFERQMWAGDLISTIRLNTPIKIISVRPTDFKGDNLKHNSTDATINEVIKTIANCKMEFVNFEEVKSDRPSLSNADVVVSGGRGLKTPDNFKKIIYPLADSLNAAIGASRAICDANWVPNDWQVGQTGKVVAPALYFAIGISGAIQHVAGMRGSKVIVAINKDPEAPIFQVSDYGIVGDASIIVPELTKKIQNI